MAVIVRLIFAFKISEIKECNYILYISVFSLYLIIYVKSIVLTTSKIKTKVSHVCSRRSSFNELVARVSNPMYASSAQTTHTIKRYMCIKTAYIAKRKIVYTPDHFHKMRITGKGFRYIEHKIKGLVN